MLNTIIISLLLTSSSCKQSAQNQQEIDQHSPETKVVISESLSDDTIVTVDFSAEENKESVPDETNSMQEEDVIQDKELLETENNDGVVSDLPNKEEQVTPSDEKNIEPEKLEEEVISEEVEEEKDEIESVVKEEKVPENSGKIGEEKTNLPAEMDHSAFDKLLRIHVSNSGNVDYKGLKRKEAELDSYLRKLGENVPSTSEPRNERLAYWINAYNAFTIKLILNNYPLKSIIDLHGGKPWDQKWIDLGGKIYSLNQIEHEIIRPRFQDARIHFAVNCAASSCPPIPNKAFTSGNLNSLLNQRTSAFINSTTYNDIAGNKVSLSKIFDWYGEDFGDLITYINKYAKVKVDPGASVGFKEYDWALNGK